MPEFKIMTASAYKVEVFIGADDFNLATDLCTDFCTKVGLCVTVEALNFAYSNGSCAGVRIGLINYARFPKSQEQIWDTALGLAHFLKQSLGQGSFTVQDHEQSYFFTTRIEDGCNV